MKYFFLVFFFLQFYFAVQDMDKKNLFRIIFQTAHNSRQFLLWRKNYVMLKLYGAMQENSSTNGSKWLFLYTASHIKILFNKASHLFSIRHSNAHSWVYDEISLHFLKYYFGFLTLHHTLKYSIKDYDYKTRKWWFIIISVN